MAIDTSIYNRVQPFTMADPYESAGKALALRSMQKKYTMEDDLAKAGAESGGDPEKMAQALLAKGHYEPALKLRAQAAALRKDQAGVLQAEQSRFASLLPILRNELAQVGDDQGLAQLRMKTATLASGFTSPQFQQMLTSMAQEIPERFDRNWQQQQLMTADDLLKRMTPDVRYTDTGGALTPLQTNPNAPGGLGPVPGAQPIQKTIAPQAPTELARLETELAEIKKNNPNDPRIPNRERILANYKAGRGTDISIHEKGPMLPGKAGANKIDEDLLGVTRGLMQLDQIQTQFKPEFQQYMDKAGFAALAVKEKAGFKLTNKQQKDLTEFASYRRNAVNSLNEYIKQITGAAMSEPEAKRILSGMPKPGDGIFDGDSPTEFKAKLDDAMQKTKMAVARLAYIKRKGMSLEDGLGEGLTLEGVPELINTRGKEIEAELKKTGASGKPLERAVRRQLGVEFGLVSD